MPLKKKSFTLHGHKTSVALENEFWNGLNEMTDEKHCSLSQLVSHIDNIRKGNNLSSALRIAVLKHFKKLSEQVKLKTDN